MENERFNMSLRKYLKQMGVTSQQEIERVVREQGLEGKGKLKVKMVLTADDVIEDVPDGSRQLAEAGVPAAVIDLVASLTRGDAEDYDAFIDRVAGTPARRVKRADVEDNSDPARLARLPAEMRERLIQKYARAIRVLSVE